MLTGTDSYDIPFKKTGMILLVIIAPVLSLLMVLMLFYPEILGRTPASITGKTLLYFTIFQLLMLGLVLYYIILLTKKTPAVVLDPFGITIHTSVWGAMEIAWEEMIRPEINISGKYRYLLLFVKHPEEIINKATSLPVRWSLKIRQKLHKTPIVIDIHYLKGEMELHKKAIEMQLNKRSETHLTSR